MLLKETMNLFEENSNAYFIEEGGSLLSSSFAYIICDSNGRPKEAVKTGSYNYSDRHNHATFVIEEGDFILGGERSLDTIKYCIHECKFQDGKFAFGGSLLFNPSSAHLFITPKFLNPFNVLKKKMNSHFYGPTFFKEI